MVVAGPLRDVTRNSPSSPATFSTSGSAASVAAQVAGAGPKLTSMMFWLGTDALSFIGESSAFSSP